MIFLVVVLVLLVEFLEFFVLMLFKDIMITIVIINNDTYISHWKYSTFDSIDNQLSSCMKPFHIFKSKLFFIRFY